MELLVHMPVSVVALMRLRVGKGEVLLSYAVCLQDLMDCFIPCYYGNNHHPFFLNLSHPQRIPFQNILPLQIPRSRTSFQMAYRLLHLSL